MSIQRFPAGERPRILIISGRGDLSVEGWDEDTIELESDSQQGAPGVRDEGDALLLQSARGDITVRVPARSAVEVHEQSGDISIAGVQSVQIDGAGGDVEIGRIDGPVGLHAVGGSVTVSEAPVLRLQHDHERRRRQTGDLDAHDVAQVEIEALRGDLHVSGATTVILGEISGDVQIEADESLRYVALGGDLQVDGSSSLTVVGGSVSGDAHISDAKQVQLGDVGGDVHVSDVSGRVVIGNTGGDCSIDEVDGEVVVGNVGGDARIEAQRGSVRGFAIGGDLDLEAPFELEDAATLTVGGDAAITLPDEPNLTISATIGGDLRGAQRLSGGPGVVTLVYGEGSARLSLVVGGDLHLRGDAAPRTVSMSGGPEAEERFGRMGQDFGRIGEDFGRIGEQIGREVAEAFSGIGTRSPERIAEWTRKTEERAERLRERIEAQARRVEERARHAEQRARHAAQRGEHDGRRVFVRVNDREWVVNQERLERLKRQAEQAAREGIAGAIEAMERALSGLGVQPSRPPVPPVPAPPSAEPAPAAPAAATRPPAPAAPPAPPAPATGVTMRMPSGQPEAAETAETRPAAAAPRVNIEEERAAILQMVAEGRISPEEGDMLMDALG